MPSNGTTAKLKPSTFPSDVQQKHRSISQTVKAAGFKDLNVTMNSRELKRHNEEDAQEAKAILNAFKQQDLNAGTRHRMRKQRVNIPK